MSFESIRLLDVNTILDLKGIHEMRFKLAMIVGVIIVSLTGCFSDKGAMMQPSQNEPVAGTRTATYPIKNELEKQGVFLAPYGKHDWILNGISGESYYLTCPPSQRCINPTEHITIYPFKSQTERDAGVAEYNAQLEKANLSSATPVVWQNSGELLIYWHTSAGGQKPAYADAISAALRNLGVGWDSLK